MALVVIGAVVLTALFGGRAWYTGQRDAKLAKEKATHSGDAAMIQSWWCEQIHH